MVLSSLRVTEGIAAAEVMSPIPALLAIWGRGSGVTDFEVTILPSRICHLISTWSVTCRGGKLRVRALRRVTVGQPYQRDFQREKP